MFEVIKNIQQVRNIQTEENVFQKKKNDLNKACCMTEIGEFSRVWSTKDLES